MTTIYTVDSFTDKPFHGNPAAVCILDSFDERVHTDQWHANVAAEMNLSETAFLIPEGERYRLRWFTPAVEVDLCGHATLASAHILYETKRCPADQELKFMTRSGELRASQNASGIELDFPATPVEACEPPIDLQKALGIQPIYFGTAKFDYLVRVATAAEIRECKPDFALLKELGFRGVIVTSESDNASGHEKQADFVSRFFAPGAGIDEDPVTGSAHCALGPYWHEELGKETMTGFQASRRGGLVGVEMKGDRVLLTGQAVTVMKCQLLV